MLEFESELYTTELAMWPFVEKYPEKSGRDVDGREYDYVIVGGKIPTQFLRAESTSSRKLKSLFQQEAQLALWSLPSSPKTPMLAS